jgi:BirA family biotin operon repressor/biotin-[acetyl-CoA-carboxylase] ligase
VLLRPDGSLPPGLYALLAGVALHEALSPHAAGLMLKWPNDLLLEGAKLGGILIDASFCAAGAADWLVIGIGANLATAPHIMGRQTAALPPPAPSPRAVAEKILARLDNTGNIAEHWRARAHPMGTFLRLTTATRSIEGCFQGITDAGALRLSGHDEPISSGEVFLAQAAHNSVPPGPRHTEAAQTCCW